MACGRRMEIMMNENKIIIFLEKVTKLFEIAFAFYLLIVIVIKVIELFLELIGLQVIILSMDFDGILSIVISLIIGVEFIKMLYKHTPETVIDVLIFAIARQMVIYHEGSTDMLVGVIAMAGLFAAKRFLVSNNFDKKRFKINFLSRKKQEKVE